MRMSAIWLPKYPACSGDQFVSAIQVQLTSPEASATPSVSHSSFCNRSRFISTVLVPLLVVTGV